jgi:peptide/nickel transport system substrate-binding protein
MRKVSVVTRMAALATVALVAACGGRDSGVSAAGAGATEPQYGGNMILASFAEPVLFNPLYSQDTASSDIEALLYVGLMEANERLEMVPVIATEQPTISEDGLEWIFNLRQDVRFHDGVQLTANDVAFTYGIFIHPDYTGPRAGGFRTLAKVEALTDWQVKYTVREADARFLSLSSYGILPRHLLADVPVAELGDHRAFNVDAPVGAGPFKFVSWTRGQSLVLEANEDYFAGRPYLDRVTVRALSDWNAGVLLLETGDIDHLEVPPNEVATVQRMSHVTLHQALALQYAYLAWNQRNPLFQDRRVRQALTHAIDRQEIVDTLLEGQAEVADAPVSPLSWAYDDAVARFPHDPARAKALLAEAGWKPGADGILQKDGKRFSFEMLSNDGNVIRRDIAVIVQQYLREVGIDTRPVQMEWGAFLERVNAPRNDFDAAVFGWALGFDPDPSAIWHSREIAQGLNYVSFRNARVDELADANIRILDRPERTAMLHETWRIIAEEQPYTFLYYPQQTIGLKSDVRGFVQHPRVDMYQVNKWWLDR